MKAGNRSEAHDELLIKLAIAGPDDELIDLARRLWESNRDEYSRRMFLRSKWARPIGAELLRRGLADLPPRRVDVVDFGSGT